MWNQESHHDPSWKTDAGWAENADFEVVFNFQGLDQSNFWNWVLVPVVPFSKAWEVLEWNPNDPRGSCKFHEFIAYGCLGNRTAAQVTGWVLCSEQICTCEGRSVFAVWPCSDLPKFPCSNSWENAFLVFSPNFFCLLACPAVEWVYEKTKVVLFLSDV